MRVWYGFRVAKKNQQHSLVVWMQMCCVSVLHHLDCNYANEIGKSAGGERLSNIAQK